MISNRCNKDESQNNTVLEVRKAQHVLSSPTVSESVVSSKEHVLGDLGMGLKGRSTAGMCEGNLEVLLKVCRGLMAS